MTGSFQLAGGFGQARSIVRKPLPTEACRALPRYSECTLQALLDHRVLKSSRVNPRALRYRAGTANLSGARIPHAARAEAASNEMSGGQRSTTTLGILHAFAISM